MKGVAAPGAWRLHPELAELPAEAARSMAAELGFDAGDLRVFPAADVFAGLDSAQSKLADGDGAMIEFSDGALVVRKGSHAGALAVYTGTTAPPGRRGTPALLARIGGDSWPEWASDSHGSPADLWAWTAGSPAAAIAEILAALSAKVLPPVESPEREGRFGGARRARPWFSSPPGRREAFLAGGAVRHFHEAGPATLKIFRPMPPCAGCFLAAADVGEMEKLIAAVRADGLPEAVTLRGGGGPLRLAVVGGDSGAVLAKLAKARPADPRWKGFPRQGIFFSRAAVRAPRVAWLFDGQGAQHFHMLDELALLFPEVREWIELFDATINQDPKPSALVYPLRDEESGEEQAAASAYLHSMEGGASLGFALNMALAELLRRCAVPCDALAGHSNGENSALIAGGVLRMSAEEVMQCSRLLVEEATGGSLAQAPPVAALAVSLKDREALDAVLQRFPEQIFLALDNCPHQVVLFGAAEQMAEAREELESGGAICAALPFTRPFHTPWFKQGAEALAPLYELGSIGRGSAPVYSCAHVKPFAGTRAEVVAMASSQFHLPVRFRELIQTMAANGAEVFLEVGPGVSLKAFVDDTLGPGRAVAVAPVQKSAPAETFLGALADLFARGAEVDPRLFQFPATVGRPHCSPTAPSKNPVPPRSSPSVDMLQGHFQLMNEFLESQRRVFSTLFGGNGGGEPMPAANIPDSEGVGRWPMLGADVTISDGGLEAARTFSTTSDPFLLDHTLGRRASRRRRRLFGIPVIPFTFSMELIAEAAHRLCEGRLHVVGVEEARGHRWLAVDREELQLVVRAKEIQAAAAEEIPGARRIRVEVFEVVDGGRRMPAFEGTVLLAPAYPAPPVPRFSELPARPPERLNVPDFYRFGMFHGPRFQNIRQVRHLSQSDVEADLQVFFLDDFFAGNESPEFLLSPNLLDCAGQLTAYSMLEHVEGYYGLFPFRVGSLRLYAPPPAPGLRVRALGRISFDGANTTMDYDYTDAKGRLLFRLDHKQQRSFRFPKRYHMATFWPEAGDGLGAPWLEESGHLLERVEDISNEFLDQGWGIWKRALAHMVLSHAEREIFYNLPSEGPRRGEWLLGRAAAKSALRRWARKALDLELDAADVEILSGTKGCPRVVCPEIEAAGPVPTVSIAHSGEVAVALLEPGGDAAGIDFEIPQRAVRNAEWLKAAFSTAELRFQGEDTPTGLIELWCAKEAAAKASGLGLGGDPLAWVVEGREGNQIHVRHGETTYSVELVATGREVATVCIEPAAVASIP